MDIKISRIPYYSSNSNISSGIINKTNHTLPCDSFEPSFAKKPKDSSKGLWNRLRNFVGADVDKPVPEYSWADVKPYHIELSKGIKERMEEDIPPSNFKNIMTPQEIREVLPKLKQNMFENTEENIKNGIYCAELDYPSNFSDGKECASEILERVANIANDYKTRTGKDFIFALADRDNINGVQHAIRIIGENPQKYKNMINFTNNIIEKRRDNTLSFIRDIYNLYPEFAYNILEFAEQNKLRYYKDYGVSNLYWRAREYAQTKGDVTIKGITVPPADVIEQAEEILDQLDIVLTGSSYNPPISKNTTIIDPDEKLNTDISNVFESYSTQNTPKRGITSSFENSYQQIITCLNKEIYGDSPENKPVIALSSPYYLSYCFEKNPQIPSYPNVINFIHNLGTKSNGMLMAFESTSPQYFSDRALDKETLDKFNEYLRNNTSLFEVGGSLFNQTKYETENSSSLS